MVEDCNKLDTENLGGEKLINHELYKTANSLFRELFGVELGFKELQCLTQQELCSFVQSSENLKKLYNAKIIDINLNDNEDNLDNLLMDIEEYIKLIVERYGTNDKLFDTILYVNDLLGKYSWGKIAITDLSELMDFFSEHIIDKVKFDILKKLSEEYDFTPMNIKYKVIYCGELFELKKMRYAVRGKL